MSQQDRAYQEAIEAEASLIRGVIDLRTDLDTPAHLSSLDPEAFMGRSHSVIWKALQAITEGGGLIDAWVVAKTMRKFGAMDADVQVAQDIFAAQGFETADLRPRISKVAGFYKRRILAERMSWLAEQVITEDLQRVEEAFSELASKVAQAGNPRLRASTDYAKQYEAYLSGKAILPPESCNNLMITGIHGIDAAIVANPGRLIVIGGLPSAGKTALAIQAAVRTSQAGKRVAMGSLEMDEDEISARIVACACGVNSLQALRHGRDRVAYEDRAILQDIRKNLVGVHGCAGDSWSSMEAAIVREHRRYPLSLAIVDYLQLLGEPDTKSRRTETEAQQIGEITKAAKKLAQRLRINVLLLSQFNRKVEECQEPTLQNFLGSGQIERDIDIALLLWNTEKNPIPSANRIINCRVAKNRGGERFGKFRLRFNPAHNRFIEIVDETNSGSSQPTGRPYGAAEPLPIGE